MAKDKIDYSFFEGKIVPTNEAKVSVKTHALQYGTGCFGGIRGYWNSEKEQLYLFRLRDHYLRLMNSAKILMMKPRYSVDELMDITIDLVRKNQWKQGIYIRPFLYKDELSLSPRLHNVSDDITIYTLPLDDYLDVNKGLKCRISSWTRLSDKMIPTRAKASGGYLNSALAKSEVLMEGFDEAIFLDDAGNISEGSAENIFIVRDNQLITPPLTASILEGITRRTIIDLAENEMGLKVIERGFNRTELYIADEVFFCGTGVQVAWIKEIDHRIIGQGVIGKHTKAIQDRYFNIVNGNDSAHENWLSPVYS